MPLKCEATAPIFRFDNTSDKQAEQRALWCAFWPEAAVVLKGALRQLLSKHPAKTAGVLIS
jgi:hypothetical protein